jgi:hypothetical protein
LFFFLFNFEQAASAIFLLLCNFVVQRFVLFFFGFGFLLFFCLWVVVVVLGRAGLLFGFCGTARVQGRRPPTEVCFGE